MVLEVLLVLTLPSRQSIPVPPDQTDPTDLSLLTLPSRQSIPVPLDQTDQTDQSLLAPQMARLGP